MFLASKNPLPMVRFESPKTPEGVTVPPYIGAMLEVVTQRKHTYRDLIPVYYSFLDYYADMGIFRRVGSTGTGFYVFDSEGFKNVVLEEGERRMLSSSQGRYPFDVSTFKMDENTDLTALWWVKNRVESTAHRILRRAQDLELVDVKRNWFSRKNVAAGTAITIGTGGAAVGLMSALGGIPEMFLVAPVTAPLVLGALLIPFGKRKENQWVLTSKGKDALVAYSQYLPVYTAKRSGAQYLG